MAIETTAHLAVMILDAQPGIGRVWNEAARCVGIVEYAEYFGEMSTQMRMVVRIPIVSV